MEINPVDDDSILLGKDLPWYNIRMVFCEWEKDIISRFEYSRFYEGSCEEVKCICCIIRIDNFMSRNTTEVLCDWFFRGLIICLRHFGEIIGASMDIGIGLLKHIRHGVDDMSRLLGRRCRVEIDEIRMRCKNREIRTKHTFECIESSQRVKEIDIRIGFLKRIRYFR